MPTRTAPETPRYDASVQRSPKHVHDREPLLIPQIFVENVTPWYRRPAGLTLAGTVLCVAAVGAFAVYRYGLDGTAERAGRAGAAVLSAFANLVVG